MKREYHKFQPLQGFTLFLVVTLSIFLVCIFITTLANTVGAFYLRSGLNGTPSENLLSLIQTMLPVTVGAMLGLWCSGFCSFILMLIWVYRMNQNAGYLSRHKPAHPPWRAALWLFLPIINIFMWGQVFSVLWNNSHPSCENEGRAKTPLFIGLVAVFFILGFIFGPAFFITQLSRFSSPEVLQLRTLMSGIWAWFLIFIVITTMTVSVWKIQKMQIRKFEYLQSLPGKNCSACGERLEENASACPVCGAEISQAAVTDS